MSAFQAFAQTLQTYDEAEEKAKQEAGTPKVERFRIGEDGEYAVRILPLAPTFDSEGNILPMDHKGYECPIHQQFLAIETPNKKGKITKINIPVIRATDKEVGFSVDLIDTYVKIACEMYADDTELIKLVTDSNYNGGLRWGYQHAIMVLDVSSEKERAKGPQLWQCSHSQYKDIDAAKMRLWKDLLAGGQNTCPISGLTGAYPVNIIRTSEKKKTEYKIEIGRRILDIQESEAEKLLSLPRIPELIYRYTRYQMEATLEFLEQYDAKHDMAVCKEPDFKEAVETLKGELPSDDTAHFNLASAATKGTGAKDETSLDSLYDEYDAIVDQGLNEKSDEYQDLREKIRQFIEDKDLDVRISRTKTNAQLLEEIEEVMAGASAPAKKAASEPAPKAQEPEDEADEPADEPEEAPAPTPRRRPRPGAEQPEEPVKEADDEPKEAPAEAPAEEPVRRRARRLR